MRATTTEKRLRRATPSPHHASPLQAVAEVVDLALADQLEHNGVLLRIIDAPDGDPEVFELGWKSLEGDHPFEVLAGFTAPPEWSAIGVLVTGRAHHLDRPGQPPTAVTSTYVVDRAGNVAGVLRQGAKVEAIPGEAEGTVPDALRRALALPTTPPGAGTSLLFTIAWLDRILDTSTSDEGRAALSSWPAVAALHPAVDGTAPGTPELLAEAALRYAEVWPWHRLRTEDGGLVLPGDDVGRFVTSWMDDGMYARWALGAYPDARTLAHGMVANLPERVAKQVLSTLIIATEEPGPVI